MLIELHKRNAVNNDERTCSRKTKAVFNHRMLIVVHLRDRFKNHNFTVFIPSHTIVWNIKRYTNSDKLSIKTR